MPDQKKMYVRSTRPARLLLAILVCAGLLAGCSESPEEMVLSARTYLEKNDLGAASIQLKNALQQNPDLADARYLLGTISLEAGDVAAAVRDLQRARELGYPSDAISPHLARALVSAGEYDKVLADYEGVSLTDPLAQAKLLAALGDAHLGKRTLTESRDLFKQALALNAEEHSARLGLARSLLALQEFEAALEETDRLIAALPELAFAHALRSDIMQALGRPDEAISALELAIKANPRALNYQFALISLYLKSGDLDTAETRLAAMKQVNAKDASTLYLSAFIDFSRDRLAAAREAIDGVLRLNPNHFPSQVLAGGIYLRQNEHVQAQRFLEMALAQAPGHPLAQRLLAASFLATGNTERAKSMVEPMTLNQTDPSLMTLAGQIQLAAGNVDSASDFFARAVDANPADVQARTRLAVARISSGDDDRGFADLEAAAALDDTSGQPEFALVLAHLRSGNYDQALAAQAQLEAKQPNNPQTFNLKGGILMAKRDLANARLAFERALELQPSFLAAAVNLVRIDLAENKPDAARNRLDAVISADPKNVDAYLLLAELQSRTGTPDLTQIKATLERGLQANPSAVPLRLAMARMHLMERDPAKARAIAQEVSTAAPEDVGALDVLARAQLAQGDAQQAISTLERVVRLQPRSAAPLVALADVQRSANNSSAALASLRKAVTLQPDLLDPRVRIHAIQFEASQFNDAVATAREIQGVRPDHPIGYRLEGDAQAAQDKWSEAASVYRKAFDLAAVGDNLVKLHAALLRSDQRAEAETVLNNWMEANPDDLVTKTFKAERALAAQNLEEAERFYRDLIAARPNNLLALNNLAWVAGQLQRDDAIELAQRALTLAPDNPAVLDTLGMLQLNRGDTEAALANLVRAVALAPQSPALQLNLAEAYQRVGKLDEARAALDALIQSAPEGSAVQVEARKRREAM